MFTSQVIYEHGEQWWTDYVGTEKLIRTQELSGNRASSHLVTSEEELEKRKRI
jgi:hypothetical protein